ncbi:MAG: ABC transporter permease [Clostridiales bacterium]|jgi:hypothetical protein|nr:ABC transporter permease [Clostridiales bacterium]
MRKMACAALGLVLSVICGFALDFAFPRLMSRVELHARNYGMNASFGTTFENAGEAFGSNAACFKEVGGVVGGIGEPSISVNVFVTTSELDEFKDFHFSSGSTFSDGAVLYGINSAMISEDLSFEIFRVADSVGQEFKLNGIRYQVCGVYKENWLLAAVSDDGIRDVYVPANSGFDKAYAQAAAVSSVWVSTSGPFAASDALGALGASGKNYVARDFSRSQYILDQFWLFVKFSGFLALSLLMAKACWLFCAGQFKTVAASLKTESLSSESNATKLAEAFIAIAATIALILVFYGKVRFELYIPSKYAPDQSFFDFSFYWGIVREKIREGNLLYAHKRSAYEMAYPVMFWARMALTAFVIFEIARILKMGMKGLDFVLEKAG